LQESNNGVKIWLSTGKNEASIYNPAVMQAAGKQAQVSMGGSGKAAANRAGVACRKGMCLLRVAQHHPLPVASLLPPASQGTQSPQLRVPTITCLTPTRHLPAAHAVQSAGYCSVTVKTAYDTSDAIARDEGDDLFKWWLGSKGCAAAGAV